MRKRYDMLLTNKFFAMVYSKSREYASSLYPHYNYSNKYYYVYMDVGLHSQ